MAMPYVRYKIGNSGKHLFFFCGLNIGLTDCLLSYVSVGGSVFLALFSEYELYLNSDIEIRLSISLLWFARSCVSVGSLFYTMLASYYTELINTLNT